MVEENEVEQTTWEKYEAGMRSFCKFLYNTETGEVMGRNGSSWAKIGVFYVIFYGCLAAFFGIVMAVFLSTLNKPGEGGPKLTQYIKNKPGLNVQVQIGLNYNQSDVESYKPFALKMERYLLGFSADGYDLNTTCPDSTEGYVGDKPCVFNRTRLGNCSGIEDSYFGLGQGMPCTFIRMNKVYDWVPSSSGSIYVELKCNGEVEVFPPGYLISAFPFRGQDFYQTPPVAVQAKKRGQKIRCHLSGKDIEVAETYKSTMAFGNIEFSV